MPETEGPLVVICDDVNLLFKSFPTYRGAQMRWWKAGHADEFIVKLLAIQGSFDIWRRTYTLRGPETIHDPPSPPTMPDFRPTSTLSMMAVPLPFSGSTVPSTAELTQLSPSRPDPTPAVRLKIQLHPPNPMPDLPSPTARTDQRIYVENTSPRHKRKWIVSRIFKRLKNRASSLA